MDRTGENIRLFLSKEMNGTSQIHGLVHSMHVEAIGLLLAEVTGADVDVIRWFAYLHDCKRTNDGNDMFHGPNAARYVNEIRDTYLSELTNVQILLLQDACMHHTEMHKSGNITVDCCFDADRLDLPRVGIMPDPQKMATDAGAKFTELPHASLLSYSLARVIHRERKNAIVFHDGYVKKSEESHFAVRFNIKVDVCSNSKSPFVPSSSEWHENAKSLHFMNPTDAPLSQLCQGIFAIRLADFKEGNGMYSHFITKENKRVVELLLLEYDQDDVICENTDEICLSQCNIVYRGMAENFLKMMEDGTMQNVMEEFTERKRELPNLSYSLPILRINSRIENYQRAMNLQTEQVQILDMLQNVSNLATMKKLEDVTTNIWACFIYAYICKKGLGIGAIRAHVNMIRPVFLQNLSNEQVELLVVNTQIIYQREVENEKLEKLKRKIDNIHEDMVKQ